MLAPVLVMATAAAPAAAQGALKLAVIDVNRIMTDSARGKAVLAGIEKLQSERTAQLKTLNEELTDMQKRFQEGRLSLAEDKLAELQAQIEEKDRRLQARARGRRAGRAEAARRRDREDRERGLPDHQQLGKEGGYTLIFNKFQSGLVYADDAVDITDQVIQRLDAARRRQVRPAGNVIFRLGELAARVGGRVARRPRAPAPRRCDRSPRPGPSTSPSSPTPRYAPRRRRAPPAPC